MGGRNCRWKTFGAFRAHRGGNRGWPMDFDPAEGNDWAKLVAEKIFEDGNTGTYAETAVREERKRRFGKSEGRRHRSDGHGDRAATECDVPRGVGEQAPGVGACLRQNAQE